MFSAKGVATDNMNVEVLEVRDLHACAGNAEILKGVDLTIKRGEIHVLMGPNGAGKSTLGNVIMGHPGYEVTGGMIRFEGEDITCEKTDVRAKKGIFLSFQTPEELPGVNQENFLRAAVSAIEGRELRTFAFHKALKKKMSELEMDERYASRYVNVGFSGGEKKKNEIFQMLMLQPKLAILDETDSGLDVDAVKTVSEGIRRYKNADNSLLIITHNSKILETLQADVVHILVDGRVIRSGDSSLVEQINRDGFASFDAKREG